MVGRTREGPVREPSLRAWLRDRHVPAPWRPSAEHGLATPWCWPHDPTLAEAAVHLGHCPPSDPGVGEALLVSVAAHDARSALWRLTWTARSHPETVPFRGTALVSLADASALATRVAPHLHTLSPTQRTPVGATQVFKRGGGADAALDDASFGLAMLLAAVSSLTERPVPARFAATAALRDDGTLGRVAGLDRKLALLADAALGVDTVLVAAAQRDEAETLLAQHGSALRVVGASSAAEAVGRVFAGAHEAPPPSWGDDAHARLVIEHLFDLCREGGAVREWGAVHRSAAWLAGRFAAETKAGFRARFAEKVARRHAQGDGVEIPWEEFVRDRDRDARVMAAHVVQAGADAGSDALPAYVDRARALIDSVAAEPDELELLGAIGRALAAMRRYDEAAVTLRHAALAWLDGTRWEEASYPLGEWLRAAALADDRAAWAEASQAAAAYLARDGHAGLGAYFVRAALARGHALRGDARAALDALDGPAWTGAPDWLWRSTRRWRALALEGCGRAEAAAALRAELLAEGDGGLVEACFAALDAALTCGDDPTAALRAVRDARPHGVRWLLDDALPAAEQARRLAREYGY